jgi:hypothetical protein
MKTPILGSSYVARSVNAAANRISGVCFSSNWSEADILTTEESVLIITESGIDLAIENNFPTSWVEIGNTQTPTWQNINNGQDPAWVPVNH